MDRKQLRTLQSKYINIIYFIVFIIVLSVIAIYIYHDQMTDISITLIIILEVPLIPVIFITLDKYLALKSQIRSIVLSPLLDEEFEYYEYFPKKGFERPFIKDMVIKVMGAIYISKDYLKATINGVPFRYSYVKIETSDGDGNKKLHFNGKVMEVDFGKSVKESVTISQAKFVDYFKAKSSIKVENISFEKLFNTYAKNPEDVFYILTPHFMEKIINFNRIYDYKVGLKFKNDKLVISINDSHNILRTYDDPPDIEDDNIRHNLKEFKTIFDLLDIKQKNN